jgi:hypothetical protein
MVMSSRNSPFRAAAASGYTFFIDASQYLVCLGDANRLLAAHVDEYHRRRRHRRKSPSDLEFVNVGTLEPPGAPASSLTSTVPG